jgi:acetyl-CoA acetyltransferase
MSETRGVTGAPMAPQLFGNAGVEHMEKYGTTAEQIAKIAEKNHRHSANNPYSQFQDVYTLQQILKSPQIHGPLTKLQCCPTSDGAACAIIASEKFVIAHGYCIIFSVSWKQTDNRSVDSKPKLWRLPVWPWQPTCLALSRRAASSLLDLT